ncbi:20784_t:CDS:2 [Cetraspora pellucida]|uniref:20784_t:CDS:1 n=1 Tax=Cetraspora pellucida TaxID=1433469 RepID=A0A9N9AER5_9GLOM|nr:20784_t:CDS:2 [Cetraspora pellucida]
MFQKTHACSVRRVSIKDKEKSLFPSSKKKNISVVKAWLIEGKSLGLRNVESHPTISELSHQDIIKEQRPLYISTTSKCLILKLDSKAQEGTEEQDK